MALGQDPAPQSTAPAAEPAAATPSAAPTESSAPAATSAPNPAPVVATVAPAAVADPNMVTIPAGTKIPLSLKQAISTKNAREGDAVYAETAFPFVINNRVMVPAGSFIQGTISHVERAGHGKGGRRS